MKRFWAVARLTVAAISVVDATAAQSQDNSTKNLQIPVTTLSQKELDVAALQIARLLGRNRVVVAPYMDESLRSQIVNGSYWNDDVGIVLDKNDGTLWQIEDRRSESAARQAQDEGKPFTVTKEQAMLTIDQIGHRFAGWGTDWSVVQAKLNIPPLLPGYPPPQWQVFTYRFYGGYQSSEERIYATINPYDGSIEAWDGSKTTEYLGPTVPQLTNIDARQIVARAYGREPKQTSWTLVSPIKADNPLWLPIAPKSPLNRLAYVFYFDNPDGTNPYRFIVAVDAATGEMWTMSTREVLGIKKTAAVSPPALVPVVSPRMILVKRLLAKATPDSTVLARAILTASETRSGQPLSVVAPAAPSANRDSALRYTIDGCDYLFLPNKGTLHWHQPASKAGEVEEASKSTVKPAVPQSQWVSLTLPKSQAAVLQKWMNLQQATASAAVVPSAVTASRGEAASLSKVSGKP